MKRSKIYPEKLKLGDEVRVITPSRSVSILSEKSKTIANKRFTDIGLKLSFGKYINETDKFNSSTIELRIKDLYDAFSNSSVKAIISVIGGFNSNQLLKYIDWELIKNNPKIFIGYSDITALNNSIFTKTGLVNYSGPHYSTFSQKLYFDYTLSYFKKCLMSEDSFQVEPSENWSDDQWYLDQDGRALIKNPGFLVINKGEAEGMILGGNLCTFNLLQGTEYFPDLSNSILFLEDDYESAPHTFDRDLQSLIHLPNFNEVKGLVIGRFQKKSNMTNELLIEIIKSKKELDNIPVIANIDFGHTDPKITFPIGGEVKLKITTNKIHFNILEH